MAHPNIDARRERVRELVAAGPLSTSDRRQLATAFGCTSNAIYMDEISLRPTLGASIFVQPKIRRAVHSRDGRICQYCETVIAGEAVAEHVIPLALGGVGQLHNLVIACQPCNKRKGSQVWLPANLDSITASHLDWKDRVLRMMSEQLTRTGLPRQRAQGGGRKPILDGGIKRTFVLTPAHLAQIDAWGAAHGIDNRSAALRHLIESAKPKEVYPG